MLVYYLNGFGYSFLSQKAFWCRLRSLISLFPLGGLDFSAEFSGLLRSSRESIRANESLFFITVAWKEHLFGVDRGYLPSTIHIWKTFFLFLFWQVYYCIRSLTKHEQQKGKEKLCLFFIQDPIWIPNAGNRIGRESEQKKNCDATSEELKRGLRLFNEKVDSFSTEIKAKCLLKAWVLFLFFCFPALHRSIQFLYSVYSFNVSYPQTCLLASVVLSCINGPKGR